LAILATKHKDDFEPYWQDEKDWLCIVEFLPTDNPEAWLFAADIIGYLVLESPGREVLRQRFRYPFAGSEAIH
jgi:hypothetical protein